MADNNKKTKALVLMSGGLDSMLAAEMLRRQGIEVTPICFESYFFGCEGAIKACAELGMELRVEDIAKEQLDVVKRPQYGHGGAVNPCIDCHLLMLKKAREVMEKEGFDLVATGEVLGERPMSQNALSLDIVKKGAGLEGKLLRPLSAKLLDQTEAEKCGSVERNKLGDISGRSRKEQLRLAEEYGIKRIPQPGGGCILTEKDYGERIRELSKHYPGFGGNDVLVLRNGRIFWEGDLMLAVARNKEDCEALVKLTRKGDWRFIPEFPGPAVLARDYGGHTENATIEELGRKYVLQYSKKAESGAANAAISVEKF